MVGFTADRNGHVKGWTLGAPSPSRRGDDGESQRLLRGSGKSRCRRPPSYQISLTSSSTICAMTGRPSKRVASSQKSGFRGPGDTFSPALCSTYKALPPRATPMNVIPQRPHRDSPNPFTCSTLPPRHAWIVGLPKCSPFRQDRGFMPR